MFNGMTAAMLMTLCAAAGPALADEAKAGERPSETVFKAFFDAGQIVKGYNEETAQDYDMQALRRSNVIVSRKASLREDIDVKLGMMGVFFFVLPEQAGAPHTRLPKFVVGATQAEMIKHFGDPAAPWLDAEVGIFPYKYNPDAMDLGEYLLRSGTYPGYLVSGGFNLLSNDYQVQGAAAHLNNFGGRLRTSFLLPMETAMPPMHSISPTLVSTFKGPAGIELGAGVTLNHFISAKPSKEAPRAHTTDDPPYMHWPTSIIEEVKKVKVPDTRPGAAAGAMRDSVTEVIRDTTRFYTFQGAKLMGRIALDPKAWFGGSDLMAPADLRLFAEAAVLGVKDYPFYYTDITRRIPIMFGMNLPTFRLLDLLCVQGEYYNSLWTNNIDAVFENQWPVPYHPSYDPAFGPESTAKRAKDDRWHWSVYAKKEFLKGATGFLQVANDHMRTFDYNIKPIKIPITSRPSDWYYLFRLELAI
jgi:hypothetical protein